MRLKTHPSAFYVNIRNEKKNTNDSRDNLDSNCVSVLNIQPEMGRNKKFTWRFGSGQSRL
jgi:hypothetical protein